MHAMPQDAEHIVLVQEFAMRGDLYNTYRQMGGRIAESQVAEQVRPTRVSTSGRTTYKSM